MKDHPQSTATRPAHVIAACALAWAIGGQAAPAVEPAEEISLVPGEATTLVFAEDVGTTIVANPETADVELLDERRIFVLGLEPDITTLKVYGKQSQLLGAYEVHVQAQSTPAQTVVARIAGSDADIKVDTVGEALFVSGQAASPAQAERLLRSIRAVAGETPVVDALSLETPAQVNLEVVISEVSRNVTQELGINWSADINPFQNPLRTLVSGLRLATGPLSVGPTYSQSLQFADLLPDGTTTNEAVLETNELGVALPTRGGDGRVVLTHYDTFNSGKYRATTFLDALAQNGLAVVHARPNLTAVSGESAQFNSGLEIPIPTATQFGGVGTEYLETGVNLSFTPVVLDNNQISLTVEPRIREVTAGGATIGGTEVPNINQRSASTTVELADGQSIAIAGLYRKSTTSTRTGFPLLKDIPIWGALFRTTRETERSVELIIVVTAHIVAPLRSIASTRNDIRNPASTAQRLGNEFYF